MLVFHEDVSTLACTRCVLHSVSSISPTKRQCEDLDALYIYYIYLPAQVEDSIQRKRVEVTESEEKNIGWVKKLIGLKVYSYSLY